jgi:cyclopropane-fatty-acyl-phospholipid synthase
VTSTSTSTQPAAPWSIDPGRWPDVAVAAGSPARAAVARALFTAAAARLPLRVRVPDGRLPRHRILGVGGPATPVMVLHRPREFFRRLGACGLIGFGESYTAGDWDCADLTGLLTVLAARAGDLVPPRLGRAGHPGRAPAARTSAPTTRRR